MSTDARYLFAYYSLDYLKPTPMQKDFEYLHKEYGGDFVIINSCLLFWDKPKYKLPSKEYNKLYADQILECKDCELWEIIK
jgi:hypothetical protein